MLKKKITLIILGSLLLSSFGCDFLRKIKSSTVINWRIGTSAGNIKILTNRRLEQIKSAGFTDIEVRVDRIKTKKDIKTLKIHVKKIRKLVEKKKINIWSVHLPYGKDIDISAINKSQREKTINEITLIINIIEKLKPEILVIHPSYEPIPASNRNKRLKACIASLQVLAQVSQNNNTQLAIECLPRSCLGNTSKEIKSILNEVESLGVCCDVNHLFQESPEEFIKTIGSDIVTVHMSDNDGIEEQHWLPRKGVINWISVLDSLVLVFYQGPFMFESRGLLDEKYKCWEMLKKDYLNFLKINISKIQNP